MKNLGVLLVIIAIAGFLLGQYVTVTTVFNEEAINNRHLLALLEPDIMILFGMDSIKDSWIYTSNTYPLIKYNSQTRNTEINPAWTSSTSAGPNLLKNVLKEQCSAERWIKRYLPWRVLGFAPGDRGKDPADVYNSMAANDRISFFEGLYGEWGGVGSWDFIKCAPYFITVHIKMANGEELQFVQPVLFYLHAISPYTGLEYYVIYTLFYGKVPPGYDEYSQYFTYYLLPAHIGIMPYGMWQNN